MSTCKKLRGFMAVILALVMCIAMLPTAAFAAEADKTLTVSADGTYTTIQDAIDYISEQDDKDGWAISVQAGTYTYFTVNQYISNLTITGEDGATVDCSNGSIQLMGDTITLDGLTFTATDTAWSVPVIKDSSSNAGIFYDSMVTIRNCDFKGTNAGCALWICRLNSTVQNCTFDGFSYAIEIINETSTAAKIDTETTTGTITIDNNTVTNCDFFIHYGVRSGITLVVTDNIVTGSADEVCASLFAWEGESITVMGNTFTYAAFGLQNAINGVSAKDFLETNTFINSYTADDYYNYSTYADYSVTYYAPEVDGQTPVWSVSETGVTGTMAENFANALKGHENDNPLTFTTTDGEGDLVCMGLAYQALNLTYATEKVSYPGLVKTIVTESGEDKQDDVAAGDTVNYKLTSTVPDVLSNYIDYSGKVEDETIIPVGTVKEDATYTLTFHDVLDSDLTLNESSFVVTVGNATLGAQYYTVTTSTTDGCAFEISMDLLELYADGVITEDDFGKTAITVTYSATLSKDATAGAYYNTAWVAYPDGKSEEDKVEVDTYGISIFKYDQSDSTTDDEGNTTYAGLAGATFGLYSDESCDDEYLITTLTSGTDGYVTYEGLDAGTYYLKEIEAPEGYVKADTVLTVVIPTAADAETFLASVSFANAPIPSTGGAGTTMYTIAGICILLAAGAIFMISRKKREV